MKDFSRDKSRLLKVEDGVDDFVRLAHPAHGCRPARNSYISGECIGVFVAAGDTAFTRMPRLAYSIASARVAAINPPFVRAVSAAGSDASGCSATSEDVMLTMWPEPA